VRTALSPVRVHQPRTLDEALRLLRDEGPLIPLAGCTDVYVGLNFGTAPAGPFLDLSGLRALRGIRRAAGGGLVMGALTTFAELGRHPLVRRLAPTLAEAARQVGGVQIQNRATLGGNIANASPAADGVPVLVAADARLSLVSAAGERQVPVTAFFTGYRKTALAPGEVVASIRIPFLASGREFAVYKLSKRFDQDISTVIAAFCLERQGGKVIELRAAFGGMAARSMRAASLESAVKGRPWTPAWLADIEGLLARDFAPIGDHRGGAAYRLRAAGNLLRRFQLETSLAVPMRVEAL
jgi:xanthine dehydrogenase small subunit